MTVVTKQPITLSYFTADIADLIATFDTVRWYRSRIGSVAGFEAATAATAAAAVLEAPHKGPHALSGKTLVFVVNGTDEVSVTFAAADPVTTAQAAAEINGVTALVVASDVSGYLRLTTAATGSGASIEIGDCDAAVYLGWESGDAVVGLDADTPLVAGVHEYFYTDRNSSTEFWYRVELHHTVTGDVSSPGVPFPAAAPTRVAYANTIIGYIKLCDMSGAPIPCRKITFHNAFVPNTAEGGAWGVFRHNQSVRTNADGYAEFRFLKGIDIDVSIDGTNFVRRLTVPSSGDSFNLLDPTLVAQDAFGIQEPVLNFPFRMS